jgi:hypothetical protein
VVDVEAETVEVGFYLLFIGQFLLVLVLDVDRFIASDHAVFVEEDEGEFPILVSVERIAFFHIVFPIAFIFRSICVVEHSKSVSYTVLPIPFISVPHEFTLALGLQPDMNTPAFLLVVFPISHILLSDICPVHSAHATLYIFPPFSFEVVAGRVVVHFAISVFHIVLEVALKY